MISLRRAHRYRARAAWRVRQSPIRRYAPPSSRSEVTLWYQFQRSIRTQENGQVSRGSTRRCEGPFRFIKKGSNHDRCRSKTPRLLVLCPKDHRGTGTTLGGGLNLAASCCQIEPSLGAAVGGHSPTCALPAGLTTTARRANLFHGIWLQNSHQWCEFCTCSILIDNAPARQQNRIYPKANKRRIQS
jgi:hypothetical protein